MAADFGKVIRRRGSRQNGHLFNAIPILLLLLIMTMTRLSNISAGQPSAYLLWPDTHAKRLSPLTASAKLLGIDMDAISGVEQAWQRTAGKPMTLIMSLSQVAALPRQTVKDLLARFNSGALNLLVLADDLQNSKIAELLPGVGISTTLLKAGPSELSFSETGKHYLSELRGTHVPVECRGPLQYISFDARDSATHFKTLLWLKGRDERRYPLLSVYQKGGGALFLYAINDLPVATSFKYYDKGISALLPYLVFLRGAFRERVWHNHRTVANFVIDDPWLIEPYGNLSYRRLLSEMNKANFHTSIAFVPWNYGRSRKEVVEIFRQHPDRFSIAIHGNNHDHYEFRSYREVPFTEQRKDLHQAIERMDKFRSLTGIAYDRVIVFPHGISPAPTLEVLLKLNFLASVNSQIVPVDERLPEDLQFLMEPAILKYYNFPLMRRFTPNAPKWMIDIEMFLGKPIIFYAHQDFFAEGSNHFNPVAQYVNRKTGGKIQWASLGRLAENLYVERLNSDGTYDVKILSRKIRLSNPDDQMRSYHIQFLSNAMPDAREIVIDGTRYAPDLQQIQNKVVSLQPRSYKVIEVVYANDFDKANVHITRKRIKIWGIRLLSDFRDLYLSRFSLGRKAIRFLSSG